jgi:hypothetical protein
VNSVDHVLKTSKMFFNDNENQIQWINALADKRKYLLSSADTLLDLSSHPIS